MFVRRWQVEVTFHEVRTHLGVETHRQWADLSILRITPALLGLFSIVTLLANLHAKKQTLPVQHTAWYVKKTLYSYPHFQTSQFYSETHKLSRLRSKYHYSRSTSTFLFIPFG